MKEKINEMLESRHYRKSVQILINLLQEGDIIEESTLYLDELIRDRFLVAGKIIFPAD